MSQISQLSNLAVSVTVTLSPPSLPYLPPVPQQPDHVVCHIILWLLGVVPFSTDRKGSSTGFFLLANTSCLWTLSWEKHERPPNVQQMWRQCSQKSVANIIYHKFGFTWAVNTIWKLVYSLKAAPTHASEPRLTEAASRCYVILNWSRGLNAPPCLLTQQVGRGSELCSDWLWCTRDYGGYGWQC